MAEEEELTHAQKVDRHFRKILGRPNPFAFAHSGTPEQRKGGLGSNKGAARYQNTSAEDRAKANSDGKFGYFDEVNKRYVPAIFDAMDGGGRDTRGDEFKGGIFSGMLNDLGVKPYGSQMERAMVSPDTSPIVQAVSGSIPRPRVRPFDAAMANQEASFDQPDSPFSGSTYDEVPNMYRFDGSTYDEVRPFTMSGNRDMQFGDQPAGSMPSMSFGQQPVRSLPSMSFGQQPAGSMPSMSFSQQPAGSMPNMSFAQQPVGSMPERAKRQIVPNPDYAVGVQQLIDYLQSNKGFMGVDNAIDDYETMLLTGRYPRG